VRTIWGISYIKGKLHERAIKYKDETPTDKAARRTATATIWMAAFTVILSVVSIGTLLILKRQLAEMHEGGIDTHILAVAAGKQADGAKLMADQAKSQSRAAEDSAKAATDFARSAGVIANAPARPSNKIGNW
jgi:hypothetical protein